MSQEYKYTIKEHNDDPYRAVIKKENVVVEFTLAEVEADKKAAIKIKEQIESQIKLDEAQAQNVVNNHPYVLEATEEEQKRAVSITLYNGLKNKIEESKKKLAEFDKVFEEYEKEKKDIKEQTGLSLPIESPYVTK